MPRFLRNNLFLVFKGFSILFPKGKGGGDIILFQLIYKKFNTMSTKIRIFYFKIMCINVCDCESPDVGIGNQIHFRYKSRVEFLTAEHL